MIDLNYLGHKLIIFRKDTYKKQIKSTDGDYKCTRCGVTISYMADIDMQLYVLINNKSLYGTFENKLVKLILTCDEMIIKQIIE